MENDIEGFIERFQGLSMKFRIPYVTGICCSLTHKGCIT